MKRREEEGGRTLARAVLTVFFLFLLHLVKEKEERKSQAQEGAESTHLCGVLK